MQTSRTTTFMQVSIGICGLCVAGASLSVAYKNLSDEQNARLVEIGVGILRADPTKETQAVAARVWALDLINAHSGSRPFSREERSELEGKQLIYDGINSFGFSTAHDNNGGGALVALPSGPK